ncbi:MAG: patatin-like protein [Pseudomonadota bacterium]
MKEKELRLAIVFFGGVSLAVYQHGINREILNLVRASKLLHRARSQADGALLSFHSRYPDEPERSTGDVYFQCLKAIGKHLALRVVVDVVSGSSAGAMNGIALARALAHDLTLAPLTDMWLVEADMLKLLAPEAKARSWSKWILRPFVVGPLLARLHREGLVVGEVDAEMQERISVFVRSRWFKPPLDGRRLANLVLDGLTAMERPQPSNESLMPSGTTLDLMVTVTDFRGVERAIFIHDPPVVNEREHRGLIRFRLHHDRAGHLHSEFDLDNVPSLAFAARASASYPGAFPTAQLREMDDMLASRHLPWTTRSRFLARNFGGYREQGRNPEDAVLVDGSILDNKPLMATLSAIRGHSAFREVDRRLVYIDPHSLTDKTPARTGVPGFFATLRGALSDLPRTDPTYNDLADLSHYNKQVRRLKETIEHARPGVAKLLDQATEGRIGGDFTLGDLRHWRLTSTNLLASTPIVYDAYMRSLVLEGLDFVACLINDACQWSRDSATAHKVQEIVEAWAARQDVLLPDTYRVPQAAQENADVPAFAKTVIDFGLVYKRRRLNFVLHEINDLYDDALETQGCVSPSEDLDLIKIQIYRLIDDLSVYDDTRFLSAQAVAQCRKVFLGNLEQVEADEFVRAHDAGIASLVKRLAVECDLARRLDDADAVLSSPLVQGLAPRCRSAILGGYLGYFYWDIILRPAVSALSLDAGPIEEILIDRISPDDAVSLRSPENRRALLGGTFAGFGGFLSRATRENDYLLGRLHAVDRLLDIVASAMPAPVRKAVDFPALKKAAFECVIEEEAQRLHLIPELVARVRAAIAALD